MPNFCSNTLDIEASPKQLVEDWWLIDISTPDVDNISTYIFNLHKILPEYYTKPYEEYETKKIDDFWIEHSITDNTFDDQRDYNKNIELTGSKWNFEMEVIDNESNFYSSFDTARSPPDKLLKAFWKLSWIEFNMHYEEPWCDFEWDIDYYNWSFYENQYNYIPICDYCDKKKQEAKWIDDIQETICPECASENNIIFNT